MMTKESYHFSKYNNRVCEFTFQNSTKVTGVVTTFNNDEPHTLYLVKEVGKYHRYIKKGDHEAVKSLYLPIELSDIKKIKLLY